MTLIDNKAQILGQIRERLSALLKENTEIFTQSRVNGMFRCAKQQYYRFILGLVRQSQYEGEDDGHNLSFGSLIHNCLEIWHEPSDATDDERIDGIVALIDDTYADRQQDPWKKQSWHYAVAMMEAYIARYPHDAEAFEVLECEKFFCGPIINPATGAKSKAVIFAGKTDISAQKKLDASRGLLEHKTASSIDASYLEKLWTDLQIIAYALYMEEQEGEPVRWVIYNILAKPKLKQSAGETEEEYQLRLAELTANSKTGRPSKAKRKMPETDEEFHIRLREWFDADPQRLHREEILVDRTQFNEVRTELWTMTQLFLYMRRNNSWPRNRQACHAFGRRCQYFEVCTGRPEEEAQLIDLYLEKKSPHQEIIEFLNTGQSEGQGHGNADEGNGCDGTAMDDSFDFGDALPDLSVPDMPQAEGPDAPQFEIPAEEIPELPEEVVPTLPTDF